MKRFNKMVALLVTAIMVFSTALMPAMTTYAAYMGSTDEVGNKGDYSVAVKMNSTTSGTSWELSSKVPGNYGYQLSSTQRNAMTARESSDGGTLALIPTERVVTVTNTAIPVQVNAPVPTVANTSILREVSTATPTIVSTVTPSEVNTATPTIVSTTTPTGISTMTPTAVSTATGVDTPVPTTVNTETPIQVSTATPTTTSTPTPTELNTVTPTTTSTSTPTKKSTQTPTPTKVATPTSTPTVESTEVPTTPLPLEVIIKSDTTVAVKGETAHYTAEIINNSAAAFTNVIVNSKKDGVALGELGRIDSLAPNEKKTFTFSHAVTMEELLAGKPIWFTCTATADGGIQSEEAEISLMPVAQATMKITKTADKNKAVPGDSITYKALIKNTGDVDINSILYEDKIGDKVIYTYNIEKIVPGGQTEVVYTYTVTEKDMRSSDKLLTVSTVKGTALLPDNDDGSLVNQEVSADAQNTIAIYSSVPIKYRIKMGTEDWASVQDVSEKYFVQSKGGFLEVKPIYTGETLTGWKDDAGNTHSGIYKTQYDFTLPSGNEYEVKVSWNGSEEVYTIDATVGENITAQGLAAGKSDSVSATVYNNGTTVPEVSKIGQIYDYGQNDVQISSITAGSGELKISAKNISFTADCKIDSILQSKLSLFATGDINLFNLTNIDINDLLIVGFNVNLSNIETKGANIRVLAGNSITIADGSVIDTRNMDLGVTIGDSGDVSMIAGEEINAPNVSILAQVEPGSIYSEGDVTLKVTNTPDNLTIASYNKTEGYSNINLGGTVKGKNVTVSGETEVPVLALPWLNFDLDVIGSNIKDTIKDALIQKYLSMSGTSLPFAFKFNVTETEVNMNADIFASGDVKVYAESDSGVSANSAFYGLALALGHSQSKSVINVGGNITAKGAVTVNTESQSVAAVNAAAKNTFNKWATVNVVEADTNVVSKIDLKETSVITGDGIDINANGYYKNSVSASGSVADGQAAPTVTVENAKSDIGTTVNGTIINTGSENVSVKSDLQSIDYVTAASGIGLSWMQRKMQGLYKNTALYKEGMAQVSKVTSTLKRKITGKDPTPTTSKFKLSASVAYQNVDNSINTFINPTAKIYSNGGIIIDSNTKQKIANSSNAAIKENYSKESPDVAAGGAAAVSFVKNHSKSEIYGEMNANGKITVDSKILYPLLFEKVFKLDDEISSIGSKAEAAKQFIKDKLSNLNENTVLEELGKAEDYSDAIQDFTDEYTTIGLFNSDAGAKTASVKAGIAGAVRYVQFDNLATSIIKDQAKINIDPLYSTDKQDVSISSNIDISNLHNVGMYKLTSIFGSKSGGSQLGGVILLRFMNNVSLAQIEKGAVVNSNNLDLNALNKRLDIGFVMAGASAKDMGFTGSAAYNSVNNETKSLIFQGANVNAKNMNINANDNLLGIDFVGGVMKASMAAGGAVGLNEIDRTVEAGIKKGDGTISKSFALYVPGKVKIDANAKGNVYLAGVAAAVKTNSSPEVTPIGTSEAALMAPKAPENKVPDATGQGGNSGANKFGLGISASVAYNNINDTVKAYVDTDNTLNIGDVDINAANKTSIYALSGGVALSTASGSYAGLAGAVSYNKLGGTTESYIKNTKLFTKNIAIDSLREGRIYSAAAGGSGSSMGSSGTGVAIAGSVTINDLTNDTKAYMDNVTGKVENDTSILAKNTSQIGSLAGGVGVSKTVGVGAAIAYNSIQNTVYANVLNSNYEQAGNLKVNAINGQHNDEIDNDEELRNDIESPNTTAKDKMDIITLGISVGVSKTLSLAGTISLNKVENNINATIENTNFVDAAGNTAKSKGLIQVKSVNDAEIISLSGAVGVSSAGGFGAAVGVNKISGGTNARIVDSKIPTTGKIDNSASSDAFMVGLGVGVAVVTRGEEPPLTDATKDVKVDGLGESMKNGTGSTDKLNVKGMPETGASQSSSSGASSGGSFGIGISGSVSVNIVNTDVVASIENTAANEMELEVGALANYTNNQSDIYTLSGAVAVNGSSSSSGAVLAGAVSYNSMNGSTDSFIKNVKVTDNDNLYLMNVRSGKIYSAAIGGAGASFQSKGVVVAGSVTINDINNSTDAYVEKMIGTVTGDTTIKSNDSSAIRTLAGGVAIGSSVGIGLAASVSLLNCNTKGFVLDSQWEQTGKLDMGASNGITTSDKDNYDILALALSAGVSEYAGIGTCATVSIINNETFAKIMNSSIVNNKNNQLPVIMTASDYSDIGSIAGGVGGSTSGGALGAAVSYNEINGGIYTGIDTSTLTTNGALEIYANADGQIKSLAAGLSMSRYASLAGSATANLISRDVTANILKSKVIGPSNTFVNGVIVKANENSDVNSIAGSAGVVGDVAIGASTAYNTLKNHVKATVEESQVLSKENIEVDANTSGEIKACSAGAAVAAAIEGEIPVGVGIAASISITLNDKVVEAYILNCLEKEEHNILSQKDVKVLAQQNSGFTTVGGMLEFGLTAGLGGSVEVTNLKNKIRAYIENSDVTALGKVSVNSDAADDLKLTSGSAGFGLFADLKGQVAVHTFDETSEALIKNATINSETQNGCVDVIAKHKANLFFINASLSTSAGGVAGATVDTSVLKNTTQAYISDNSTIYATYLTVNTDVNDEIKKVVAGAAISAMTLSGVVAVNEIAKNSLAYIDGSEIFASKDIEVKAYNRTYPDTDVGNGTYGTYVASGTAMVNNINNITKSTVTASKLNGKEEVRVLAEGDDGVNNLGVAVDISTAAISGLVIVNVVKSTVEATVGATGAVPVLINQDLNYQGDLPKQKLIIKSVNSADVKNNLGKGALSKVNVGAALDVSKLVTRTIANIGKATKVYIAGDITIQSDSKKVLNSTVVAAQGGVLNVNGSISILSVGEFDSEDARKEISSDMVAKIEKDVEKKDMLSYSSDQEVVEAKDSYQKQELSKMSDLLSFSNPQSAVTGAFVEDGTSEADAVNIACGGTLSIIVNGKVDTKSFVGEATASLVPIGASVAIVDIKENDGAYIGAYSKVTAKNLNILTNVEETGQSKAHDAKLAGIGIKYNLAKLNVEPVMRAYIGNAAIVNVDENINVKTQFTPENLSEVVGLGAGVASVGVSNTFADVKPIEESFIGENAKVSAGAKTLVGNPEIIFVGQAEMKGNPQLKFEKMQVSGEELMFKKIDSEDGVSGSITHATGDFVVEGYYLGQTIVVKRTDDKTANILSYKIVGVTPQTIKVLINSMGEMEDETTDKALIISDNKISRLEGSFIEDGFGAGGISIQEGSDIYYYKVSKISDDGKLMYIDRNFRINKDGTNSPYEFGGEIKSNLIVKSANKDMIVRKTGTWNDDQIKVGETLIITGTEYNDGEYIVANIEDGNKIILDSIGKLKAEVAKNISIDKLSEESENNSSIEISSRTDVKSNPSNKVNKFGVAVNLGAVDVSVTKAVYDEKVNSFIATDARVFSKGRLGIGASSSVKQNAQTEGYGANLAECSNYFADATLTSSTQSTIGENVNIYAKSLEFISDGKEENALKSVTGSGSAVGSVYMKGGIDTDAASIAEIKDNVRIKANRIVIKTAGTNTLDNTVNAITIAGLALGNSAAESNSKIKSYIKIGNNILIDSDTYEMTAKTNTDKKEVNSKQAVDSVLAGLIVQTTQLTDLNVNSDALIDVGENVTLNARLKDKNSAVMFTENNVNAKENIDLKVAAVVTVPVIADTDIDVTSNSKINIGKNTNINTDGDVSLESLSNVDAKSTVDVTVLGALSVATRGDSEVLTYADNNINVSPSSKIKANGFVNIYAGLSGYNVPTVTGIETTGNDFNYKKGKFDIYADADINNWTAVPIHTSGSGHAKLDEKNTITLDGDIFASRDVRIFANPGVTLVEGIGDCHNPYVEALDMDFRINNGEVIINQNNVAVNGIIDASVNEKVVFNVKEDGTLSSDSSKGTEYTITEENVVNNLINEYRSLEKMVADYAKTDAEAGLRIQFELVKAELKAMGYWDKDVDTLKLTRLAKFINLSPVTSALTSVFIEGNGVVYDINKISISKEASIDIKNESPFNLRVKNVTIPNNNGGYVYVNGFQKKLGKTKPIADIIIQNTYTKDNRPDIEILGNVENKAGNVKIYSSGGIIVKGTMSAGKILDVKADGKFVQKYVDALIHLGGEPISLYNGSAEIKNTISGSSVFIAARELNVNGKIQAGSAQQQLVVDNEIITQIRGYETSKIVTTNYEDCPLYNKTSNIKAFWDPVAKKIIVKNINAQGGNVYLAGQIMSTIRNAQGKATGEIEALDGYSNINIVNGSDYDVEFMDVEVGTGVEGKVNITDTAPMKYNPSAVKEPVIIQYTRINGIVYEKIANDGNGNESEAKPITDAAFNPLTGLRYTWVTGERSTDRETIIYGSSSFWGIDWLARDPGDVKFYEKIILDKVPLVEGEYVEYRPLVTELYKEEKSTVTMTGREMVFKSNWTEESGWWIFKTKTYYTKHIFETGKKDIVRRSIDADAPISVRFVGNETGGNFSIQSTDGVITFNKGFGNDLTDIHVDAEQINTAQAVVLSAKGITLNAKNGIGSVENPLALETKTDEAVNIESLTGNAYILQDNGQVTIDNANVPEGDLIIVAEGDIKLKDTSKSILAKGIDFTSRTGSIADIKLQKVENPLKADAKGDISIYVLDGDAKVGQVVSRQGNVKVVAPKGNIIVQGSVPKLSLVDLKGEKKIVDVTGNSANIKGKDVILEAKNVGDIKTIVLEKNALDSEIIKVLGQLPNIKEFTKKETLQVSPLTAKDIKKEFIALLKKDEKSKLTQYLVDQIKAITNTPIDQLNNDENFAQILNSIVFFDCTKFYEDVKTLVDPKLVNEEMMNLIKSSSKTVEEEQRLNRLILEVSYPKEIEKSTKKEVEVAYVEIPYYSDVNIQSGKLSILSGMEEEMMNSEGKLDKVFVPGNVYVDSEGNLGIGSITGDEVLILAQYGIRKAEGDTSGVINGSKVLLVVKGAGDIGSEAKPMEVYAGKLSAKSPGLVAIVTKDKDHDEKTKENINVGYIYGLEKVSLTSTGGILNAEPSNQYNIETRKSSLIAADAEGTGKNPVKVNILPPPPTPIPAQLPGVYVKCGMAEIQKLELIVGNNKNVELSPEFASDILNYTASVPNEVTDIVVNVEKHNHEVVTVSGNTNLKVGKNIISLLVTAENGNTQTYFIEVTRKEVVSEDKGEVPGGESVVFSDISKHWAKEAIMSLVKKGIVTGYGDSKFRPDIKITRAEMAVLLMKAKGIIPSGNAKLDFVDANKIPKWAAGYIKEAVRLGVITGYPDHTIKATQEITRAEAIVMMMKAFGKAPASYQLKGFKDSNKIPGWASGYISAAYSSNIFKCYPDNTLKVNNSITRAEVVAMLAKCLEE